MNGQYILDFISHELHLVALGWMLTIYSLIIYSNYRMALIHEKAPKKGSAFYGVFSTYSTIFMPWMRESGRKHFWRWLEFGIYHIGAGIAIASVFILSLAPELPSSPVRSVSGILLILAMLAGLIKLSRRIIRPEMRAISTADDYFSLVALEVFFLASAMALMTGTIVWQIAFFSIAILLHLYVPFSKIVHYLYFILAGIAVGTRYGLRGVTPFTGKQF